MQANQQFVFGSTSLWWKSSAAAIPASASTFNPRFSHPSASGFTRFGGLICRRTIRIYSAIILWLVYLAATCQGSESVTLAWNPSTDPNVAGYMVYWGQDSAALSSSMDVGTNTSATVNGLTAGSTNFFAVASYNAADLQGTPSAEIAYLVPGALMMSAVPQPGGPVTLTFPVAPGHWYEVLASPDLVVWTSLWQGAVETANMWRTYSDAQAAGLSRRFYQTVQH